MIEKGDIITIGDDKQKFVLGDSEIKQEPETIEKLRKTFREIEKEQLMKILEKFNCGKCRYLCRAYGQCCCCWAGLDKDKALLPDFWFPYVCKNFESLREGEELSNVYDRLKK